MIPKYSFTLAVIAVIIFTGCKNEFDQETETPDHTIIKTLCEEPTLDSSSLIESISIIGSTKSISFEGNTYCFQLSNSFELTGKSENYYSFSTSEEFGPNFTIQAISLNQSKIINSTSEVIEMQKNKHKKWSFDRKEVTKINGIEFSLIMAADTSSVDQINYEFILNHIGKKGSLEFRYLDGSLHFNYSPKEALMQMKAAVNKLFRSIQINPNN